MSIKQKSALSNALESAADIPSVPDGFSGASPREICQLYAIGQIDRQQLIDELSRWHYPPIIGAGNPDDDLRFAPDGSWNEVEEAAEDGLIDWSLYDEVLDALPGEDE